jgi:hypothetical protein
MATYDSEKFAAARLRGGYGRADVELHGVDQVVPSYEGRIFVNRPDADRDTPTDAENGYLGSYFVFGKEKCWGDDETHCAQPAGRKFDYRRSPTRDAKIRVRTPEGRLAELVAGAGDELTLNLVAVLPEGEGEPERSADDVLRFERLAIVTYA